MTPVDPKLLASLPQLICDRISTLLPDLRECATHPGRFDLKELKAFMAKAPAMRVALLGIDRAAEQSGPSWEHPVRLAAFIVTKDAPNLPRDVAAITIAQALVAAINGQRWGSDCLGEARQVRATNLYSAGLRGQGTSLWTIDWSHPIQLHRTAAADDPLHASLYAAGLESNGQPVEVGS